MPFVFLWSCAAFSLLCGLLLQTSLPSFLWCCFLFRYSFDWCCFPLLLLLGGAAGSPLLRVGHAFLLSPSLVGGAVLLSFWVRLPPSSPRTALPLHPGRLPCASSFTLPSSLFFLLSPLPRSTSRTTTNPPPPPPPHPATQGVRNSFQVYVAPSPPSSPSPLFSPSTPLLLPHSSFPHPDHPLPRYTLNHTHRLRSRAH